MTAVLVENIKVTPLFLKWDRNIFIIHTTTTNIIIGLVELIYIQNYIECPGIYALPQTPCIFNFNIYNNHRQEFIFLSLGT